MRYCHGNTKHIDVIFETTFLFGENELRLAMSSAKVRCRHHRQIICVPQNANRTQPELPILRARAKVLIVCQEDGKCDVVYEIQTNRVV